jgi:hypothetical protein
METIFRLITLVTMLSLICCVANQSDPQEGQTAKTERPTTSSRIIVTTTSGYGRPTTQGEDSTKLPSHEDYAVVNVDYATVIGHSPEYYGVEYSWMDQDEDLYLNRYRRLHGNVVRVQILHELFEPLNDNKDPNLSEIDFYRTVSIDSQMGKTMTYARMFKSLAAEFPDMHFQINIWLCARWNATKPGGYLGIGGAFPPKDYAEHREFIRALARWLIGDCGIPPDHLSFTFINEPNLSSFFVGTQADLIQMAEETRRALDQVSPQIQMGGLDEVHGTQWTSTFYSQPLSSCCNLWTFHVYERGLSSMWRALQTRTTHLSQYGPVWVTEFADINNGSPDTKMNFSTREAALGFAELLGRLWPSGIDGIIHFRLSDTYTDRFRGWVGHGLFADARGTHIDGQAYEPFPAYWVFANMYRELGNAKIVKTTSPSDLTVVGARKGKGAETQLALWVTNSTVREFVTMIKITEFPAQHAQLQIFDNLVSDRPVATKQISGEELGFQLIIPQESSYLFVFKPL